MDTIKTINEAINEDNIETILEALGFDGVQAGSIARACCKLHGGSQNQQFIFDTEKKYYYCHTCGECGDAVQLVRDILDLGFKDAVAWLCGLLNITFDGNIQHTQQASYMKDIYKWMKAVQTQSPLDEYILPHDIKQISNWRSFRNDTLEHFMCSYSKEVGRVICPIKFDGKIIGSSNRRIRETDYIKWKHEPTGLKRNAILYNLPDGFVDEIIICEGMLDVWCWWELGKNAVALLGTSISEQQIQLLQKHTLNITICLDGDEAGVIGAKKAYDKLKYRFTTKVITLPKDKDCEDIHRQDLLKHYNNRR